MGNSIILEETFDAASRFVNSLNYFAFISSSMEMYVKNMF